MADPGMGSVREAEMYGEPYGSMSPAARSSHGYTAGVAAGIDVKDYVEAQVATVRAETDSLFRQVMAELLVIKNGTISPRSLWTAAASIVVSILGIGLAILAFAGDRFDSGLSAGALQRPFVQDQEQRDAAQDARLDRVIRALKKATAPNPKEPPSAGTAAAP